MVLFLMFNHSKFYIQEDKRRNSSDIYAGFRFYIVEILWRKAGSGFSLKIYQDEAGPDNKFVIKLHNKNVI